MTALRIPLALLGAVSLLGALHPGTRVAPGRFSQAPGPPMPRAGRVMLLVLGVVLLLLAATCGRT